MIYELDSWPQVGTMFSGVHPIYKLFSNLQVIEEYKYAIVPKLDELEKGVIHGDANDMNILVGLKPGGRLVTVFIILF